MWGGQDRETGEAVAVKALDLARLTPKLRAGLASEVAILRAAFQDTLKDPAFLEEVKTTRIDVDGPSDGAAVEALIRRLYATPKPVVERVSALRNRTD